MPRQTEYLLIGGGMASLHAYRQIRRAGETGSILLVSEEPLPPYDRPPLSKEYLRGEKTLEQITFEPVEKLQEQGVELLLGTQVTGLDPAARLATLADGDTVRYGKALIATGGRPIVLGLPGVTMQGVHYLRTAADVDAIRASARTARTAAVIGGGFIGLEVAASLTQMGLKVTVIEAMPHIWARFADATLAGFFQNYCSQRGVTFRVSETVEEIRGSGRVTAVATRGGAVIDADLVVIGVGIRPNVELAHSAGLAVDNGIVVDEFMRTSDLNIYAAGDVVNYFDPAFGKRRRVEHWGHAEYSGQIAGRNMAGGQTAYDFMSYVWSDIFDLRLEAAGDESERDQVLLRGSFEAQKFTVLFLKAGKLTAYFGVNADMREFSVWRRLIKAGKDLSERVNELADPGVEARSFL